jgi:hypothetical protein
MKYHINQDSLDEGDDESCIVCGMGLVDDPEEGTHDWNGFCSLPCRDGYEYWEELCAVTEIGVTISPKLWRPDCVRPMFDLLCGELQRDSGDGKTDNVERWSKTIYRGTSCGASLRLLDNQTIEIGSIVEGVDEGAEPYALSWPFTAGEFWDAVKTVEARCADIWEDTHGCSECAAWFT